MLLAFIPLEGATLESPSAACGKEIQQIDKQVQKLEKQKQQHLDAARQYQQQGDNWNYSSGNIQDGYKAWNKASDERQKAIDLQHQIDTLLQRKQRIYQYYPELWQP